MYNSSCVADEFCIDFVLQALQQATKPNFCSKLNCMALLAKHYTLLTNFACIDSSCVCVCGGGGGGVGGGGGEWVLVCECKELSPNLLLLQTLSCYKHTCTTPI